MFSRFIYGEIEYRYRGFDIKVSIFGIKVSIPVFALLHALRWAVREKSCASCNVKNNRDPRISVFDTWYRVLGVSGAHHVFSMHEWMRGKKKKSRNDGSWI